MKKSAACRFIIVLLGATLLGACGKSVDPNPNANSGPRPAAMAAPSSVVEVCALLPKDDVAKVLGQAVEGVTAEGLGGVCSYKSEKLSIDLTVLHSGGTQYLHSVRTKLGADALDVPGLGDEAFFNPNAYALLVRKGDAGYLISMNGSAAGLTDTDRQVREKALAEQLLSHLH